MPATQKEWIKRLQKEGWVLDHGGKHQRGRRARLRLIVYA
jgi:putative NADPH-quinone reductase